MMNADNKRRNNNKKFNNDVENNNNNILDSSLRSTRSGTGYRVKRETINDNDNKSINSVSRPFTSPVRSRFYYF
jgi:hypothetical protein